MTNVAKMYDFVRQWAADPMNKMLLLDEGVPALAGYIRDGKAGSASSVVEVMGTRAGAAPQAGADLLGDYTDVVEAWGDADAVGAALQAALDRHVKRSKTKRKGDLAEFEDVVMYAFPAEVLAVVRVREQLGLATPEPDHPLWQSPLTQTRANGDWPSDDTLATIARLP